jgi:site-specific recombinase XerD
MGCRGWGREEDHISARHTHATLLLSHGVDIYTVSKLLEHKHVVSTERYAHVTDKLKMEAINKLAKIQSEQID